MTSSDNHPCTFWLCSPNWSSPATGPCRGCPRLSQTDYVRDLAVAQSRKSSRNCSRLRGRVGLQSKFRAWLSLCERPDGP